MSDHEMRSAAVEGSGGACSGGPRIRTKLRVRLSVEVVLALPLVVAVILTSWRVGEAARFVTWPVVAFTALAAAVAMVGLRVGLQRPWLLVGGVLPALIVSYFLPMAPLAVVAGVLVCLGGLAVRASGIAAGMAMTVGVLMVLLVVLQGPVVECRQSDISTNSGPWWVPSASRWSSSSTGGVTGEFSGRTQVGDHHYTYVCDGGRLTEFKRAR